MKTFYAIVWLTILAFLFLAILMQTSCSSVGYGDFNYAPAPTVYIPPVQQQYFVPYQPTIQPLNIDTAFHPAPPIP